MYLTTTTTFPNYLKALIVAKGMKLGDVATRLGCSQPGLSNVVTGRCSLTIPMALKLEKLGIGLAKDLLLYQLQWKLDQHRQQTT